MPFKTCISVFLLQNTIFWRIFFPILSKSMATDYCLVTNIIQNILINVQQKKESHTSLEQHKWVNDDWMIIVGWTIPLRRFENFKSWVSSESKCWPHSHRELAWGDDVSRKCLMTVPAVKPSVDINTGVWVSIHYLPLESSHFTAALPNSTAPLLHLHSLSVLQLQRLQLLNHIRAPTKSAERDLNSVDSAVSGLLCLSIQAMLSHMLSDWQTSLWTLVWRSLVKVNWRNQNIKTSHLVVCIQ